MVPTLVYLIEKNIQQKLMKYLRSRSFGLVALFIATIAYCQDNNKMSDLRNFPGIWKFIPPEMGYDSLVLVIHKNLMIDITYWNDTKNISIYGKPTIIGFSNVDDEINKLSDLKNRGNMMHFYETNIEAPNDSIKYFESARSSGFASYNGIGTDEYEQPHKGQPNYLLFNFNGRDYEYYQQCTHLPNYIVQSLLKQNRKDWQKVRELLPYDYKIVRVPKTTIYSQPNVLTRMYLLKDDVVEVTEEKGEWLQIKYYIEKKNKDTGRTIEGWIKKSDVE